MGISDRARHVFRVLSNVRPLVWMCIYFSVIPLFALIYMLLPAGQFRIPDSGGTDYGSWLYYSIVTITTLGFGDYTPAHGWAQAVTAVEVGCGLLVSGLFLNAVGSMKSEIDVTAEVEKQRRLHRAAETDKLRRSAPTAVNCLNIFLAWCREATTPASARGTVGSYDAAFNTSVLEDMYKPATVPGDGTAQPAVTGLLRSAHRCSLVLDSLQTHIDTDLWPELVEKCFTFVAECQTFNSASRIEAAAAADSTPDEEAMNEVGAFIRRQGALALGIEQQLGKAVSGAGTGADTQD